MKTLFFTWTRTEVWSAAVGVLLLVLTVIGNLTSIASRPTVTTTSASLILVIVWMVFLLTRHTFVLTGYIPVMSFLESLARHAKHRLWTVRTHLGEAHEEQGYFEIIEHRIKDPDPNKRLTDFRRVIRLGPRSRTHVQWLVEHLGQQTGVEVRFIDGMGPQFDFLIVDGRVAVIGFPTVGGKHNMGAVVLRRRAAVEGVESVFISLWEECRLNTLFEGSKQRTLEDVRRLNERVQTIVL
jgi:hypothetical protein